MLGVSANMPLIGSRDLLRRTATNRPPFELTMNASLTLRLALPPPVSPKVLPVNPPGRVTLAPVVASILIRILLAVKLLDKSVNVVRRNLVTPSRRRDRGTPMSRANRIECYTSRGIAPGNVEIGGAALLALSR